MKHRKEEAEWWGEAVTVCLLIALGTFIQFGAEFGLRTSIVLVALVLVCTGLVAAFLSIASSCSLKLIDRALDHLVEHRHQHTARHSARPARDASLVPARPPHERGDEPSPASGRE
jgi:hypothetical protein